MLKINLLSLQKKGRAKPIQTQARGAQPNRRGLVGVEIDHNTSQESL